MVKVQNNLGTALTRMGDGRQALPYFQRAIQIQRTSRRRSREAETLFCQAGFFL